MRTAGAGTDVIPAKSGGLQGWTGPRGFRERLTGQPRSTDGVGLVGGRGMSPALPARWKERLTSNSTRSTSPNCPTGATYRGLRLETSLPCPPQLQAPREVNSLLPSFTSIWASHSPAGDQTVFPLSRLFEMLAVINRKPSSHTMTRGLTPTVRVNSLGHPTLNRHFLTSVHAPTDRCFARQERELVVVEHHDRRQ